MDIVDRLRFDAVRCETQFSKGVASNITEAADTIERLRNAVDVARSAMLKVERLTEEGRASISTIVNR